MLLVRIVKWNSAVQKHLYESKTMIRMNKPAVFLYRLHLIFSFSHKPNQISSVLHVTTQMLDIKLCLVCVGKKAKEVFVWEEKKPEKRNDSHWWMLVSLSDALPNFVHFKRDKFSCNVSIAAHCIIPVPWCWNMSAMSPKAAKLTVCLI